MFDGWCFRAALVWALYGLGGCCTSSPRAGTSPSAAAPGAALQKVAKAAPAPLYRAEADVLRGLFLAHRQSLDAAASALEKAFDPGIDSAFVAAKLAGIKMTQGQPEQAAQWVRRGLLRQPQQPALRLLQGELALHAANFSAAIVALQSIVDPPMRRQAAVPLVTALLEQNHVTQARRRSVAARLEAPADGALCLALAVTLEDHAVLDEAQNAYHQARLQRPSDPAGALGEARVALARGCWDAAQAALLSLSPSDRASSNALRLRQALGLRRPGRHPRASNRTMR